MLRYVSHGPRPFGAKPFAPIRRPYWEFFAVVAGQLAPVATLAEEPAEKRRCDALARELMPYVWVHGCPAKRPTELRKPRLFRE